MKTELLKKILKNYRDVVETAYLNNQNDESYDLPLAATIIIDRGDSYNTVMLPRPLDKDALIDTLHNLVENMDSAPEPFHAVAIFTAGIVRDPETNERTGECALVSIETDTGQQASLFFEVTRAYGQVHCTFKHEAITEPPQSSFGGYMQGFFSKRTHH